MPTPQTTGIFPWAYSFPTGVFSKPKRPQLILQDLAASISLIKLLRRQWPGYK
jgi:hypothetical protein